MRIDQHSFSEEYTRRLLLYLKVLNQMLRDGKNFIKLDILAIKVDLLEAQVLADLRQISIDIRHTQNLRVVDLIDVIREGLSLNKIWKVGLIGLGGLSKVFFENQALARKGFEIVMVLEIDQPLLNSGYGGIIVQDLSSLEEQVRTQGVELVILGLSGTHHEDISERLVKCGIKGILNYSGEQIRFPPDLPIVTIEPLMFLPLLTSQIIPLSSKIEYFPCDN